MMHWLDSKLRHKAWWRRWRGLPDPTSIPLSKIALEAFKLMEDQLRFAERINRSYLNMPEGGKVTIKRPQRFTP